MPTVQLGFKAFDPHELLCHFVAQRSGLYEQEGFQVELVDLAFRPDSELPEGTFSAACGSALFSAVLGADLSILFVAADRPMFWLWGASSLTDLRHLKGGRVASFPSVAPPAHFLASILKNSGIRPGLDVHLADVRDDVARLGLLRNEQVEAALLSSATSEVQLRKEGLNPLLFLGAELQIPATGLAVQKSFLKRETRLVRSFLRVHKSALQTIQGDEPLIREVLRNNFGLRPEEVDALIGTIHFCFGGNGRVASEVADLAVQLAARELSLKSTLDSRSLYDFSLLESPESE